MKLSFAISLVLAALLGTNAMASNKTCYGSTKSDDTKGLVMSADIEANSIVLKPIKGETYNGTYPRFAQNVKGRDGVTYLQYTGEDTDQQDYIMVDQALLSHGTTGLLQIRSRGEGYFNSVFVCRDSK
jgi:hypothetical protein